MLREPDLQQSTAIPEQFFAKMRDRFRNMHPGQILAAAECIVVNLTQTVRQMQRG